MNVVKRLQVPVLNKVRKDNDDFEDDEQQETPTDLKSNGILVQNQNINELLQMEKNCEEGIQNDSFSLGDDFNKIMMSDEGYEGAIVLEPKPGIYIEDPITYWILVLFIQVK